MTRARSHHPIALLGAAAMTIVLLAGACGRDSTTSAPTTTAAATGKEEQKIGSIAGPPDGTKPAPGGQLVFGIEAQPEGLDPTRYVFSSSGHSVASAVFDPLATLDKDGRAVPYLAKSIVGTDGNKTWTITLPDDVKFHDGEELTADIVIQNLQAFSKSYITQLAFQQVASMEATDKTHVVVKLSKPWAAFPTALTSQFGYVISPKMLADPNLLFSPIGTGPFVFDNKTEAGVWSFKQNPSYWRKDKDGGTLPYLERISFKPLPDNAARLEELQSGDVDVMHTNRPQQILTLRSSDFKRVENTTGEEDFLIFNTQKPPFDNVNARRAVAYASDLETWRRDRELGVEQFANSPFAPGQPGYLEDNGAPRFDMAKAKELVQAYEREAGSPLEFEFQTADEVNSAGDAQFFTALYEQAGMKVTVKRLPQINLVAFTATGGYQLARFRNFGFPDVDTDTVFWRSTSVLEPPNVSLNFPRYVNPDIDTAIDAALASSDPVERDKQYQTVSKIWADQVPYVFMGRPVWILAAQPHVNGIYAAANGSIQTIGAKTWISELWVQR